MVECLVRTARARWHALPNFPEALREMSPTHGAPACTSLLPPSRGRWGTWTMPSLIKALCRSAISPCPKTWGIPWCRSFIGMV